MANSDEPAFPGTIGAPGYGNSVPQSNGLGGQQFVEYSQGMTLRDYFAGQALAGMAGNEAWNDSTTFEVSEVAYAYADSMLAERVKPI